VDSEVMGLLPYFGMPVPGKISPREGDRVQSGTGPSPMNLATRRPTPVLLAIRTAAILFAGGLFAGGRPPAAAVSRQSMGGVQLREGDRILVLAPHPDDEVLGAAGVLRETVRRGLPTRVVFLTYGDSNEWSFLAYRKRPVFLPRSVLAMGTLRRQEGLAAAAVLGVPAGNLSFLGYPDCGTLALWRDRWGTRPPGRGRLTRATAVPYSTAYRPGAPFKGEEILADLETTIRITRPCICSPASPSGICKARCRPRPSIPTWCTTPTGPARRDFIPARSCGHRRSWRAVFAGGAASWSPGTSRSSSGPWPPTAPSSPTASRASSPSSAPTSSTATSTCPLSFPAAPWSTFRISPYASRTRSSKSTPRSCAPCRREPRSTSMPSDTGRTVLLARCRSWRSASGPRP